MPVFRCSCAKRTSVSWRRLAAWRNRLVSKTNEFANSKRNSNCCDAAPPTLTRAPASCNHDVIANLHILWREQSCDVISLTWYCIVHDLCGVNLTSVFMWSYKALLLNLLCDADWYSVLMKLVELSLVLFFCRLFSTGFVSHPCLIAQNEWFLRIFR